MMARAPSGKKRRPGGSPTALESLRDLHHRGRASPRDFPLLLEALEELAAGLLAAEIRNSPRFHVAFRLEGGAPLGCVEVQGKNLVSHTGEPEPGATRVTLQPAVAERALTRHPAKALIDAYMSGAARVEGEVSQFMTLVSLLEDLASALARDT